MTSTEHPPTAPQMAAHDPADRCPECGGTSNAHINDPGLCQRESRHDPADVAIVLAVISVEHDAYPDDHDEAESILDALAQAAEDQYDGQFRNNLDVAEWIRGQGGT